MKKKQVLAFALLALLWFATVGQTLGQTRTAGVHEDDKFTYTITAFWSSVNASATVPDDLVGINGTLYYRVAVSTILASNVTTQDTWHYSNGTESTAIVVQDVDSGSSYVMKGLVNVVGSNLGPGDLLYPTGNDPRRINQTISVDYGSSKRDASAVVYDFPTLDSLNNVVGYEKSAFYFDKATGMLVARSDFTSNAAENVSIVILLANTNLWSITKSPSITSSSSTPSASSSTPTPDSVQVFGITLLAFVASVVAAIVIAVVAFAVVLRGRRGRKKKFRR